MSEFYVVKVTTRKLRSEAINNPTTGVAILPMGCVVKKISVAPDLSWWEVSTQIRADEELGGFIEHAALRPVSSIPEFYPRAILQENGAVSSSTLALGPNEIYRSAIETASQRTGMDSAALAALIDAEAAKDGGVWNPNSSNARSSALGLTQFIEGTWIDMATKHPGSMLNERARSEAIVDGSNRLFPSKRADLLRLRLDPTLSIVSAAEYAALNLAKLASSGLVPESASSEEIARLAYLAHHEGLAGAIRYLRGSIPEERAKKLVQQNVGASQIDTLRRQHGSWKATYTAFLDDYIEKKIRPERFRA